MDTPYEILIKNAYEAKEKAYSPYSSFKVGAALMCSDGSIYTGCNIENASYTPTCCAERVAFFSAVSAGKRDFSKIAVVGGDADTERARCYPCGVCRQVMREFCGDDFEILIVRENNEFDKWVFLSGQVKTIKDILHYFDFPEGRDNTDAVEFGG